VKKTLRYAAAVAMGCLLLFFSASCSKGPDEKGRIEKMTEEAGKAAVDRIKTPIDKATEAKAQQEKKDRQTSERIGGD
jgi:hypothetical protein